MKRSSLILLIFFIVGCDQISERKSLSNKLYVELNHFQNDKRNLASENESKCFKQRFNIKDLKNEISYYESKYNEESIESRNWRGIELSNLPLPQANFLILYGDKIGDQNEKKSSLDFCKDLICVINFFYGGKIPEAGYVHYLWFLKFGQLLSIDNVIPRQVSKKPGVYNGKEISFENYLFSKEELKNFWTLSHLIDDPIFKLPTLKEIQRVPRGELFEETSFKKHCGLSSPAGWIKLTDECLGKQETLESGYLLESVTHEIGHHIDFFLGKSLFQIPFRSEREDYLKVAGFYLDEYVDENNYIFRNWKLGPEARSLNHYSSKNPQESFAEVSAYFRLNPEFVKTQLGDDHFNWMKNEVFKNKEFLEPNFFQKWIDTRRKEIFDRSIGIFLTCKNEENCRETKVLESISELISEIKYNEPEGCQKLEKDKSLFNQLLKSAFEENIKFISMQESSSYQFNPNEQFEGEMAIRSYFNCYFELDQEKCYARDLDQFFNKEDELKNYLSFYPFLKMDGFINKRLQEYLLGHVEMINEKAIQLFQVCSSYESNEELNGRSFFIPPEFLKISIYNCLNKMYDDFIHQIVDTYSEINHVAEKKILSDKVQVVFNDFLKNQYFDYKKLEFEKFRAFLECKSEIKSEFKFHSQEEVRSYRERNGCQNI